MSRALVLRWPEQLELVTPYTPAFIADLKDQGWWARFNRDNKTWSVSRAYSKGVLELLLRHFDEVLPVEPVTPVGQAHRDLCVQPDAPPEVVRAAYRALAGICHPDHGGSTERMQRINAAWEFLREKQ